MRSRLSIPIECARLGTSEPRNLCHPALRFPAKPPSHFIDVIGAGDTTVNGRYTLTGRQNAAGFRIYAKTTAVGTELATLAKSWNSFSGLSFWELSTPVPFRDRSNRSTRPTRPTTRPKYKASVLDPASGFPPLSGWTATGSAKLPVPTIVVVGELMVGEAAAMAPAPAAAPVGVDAAVSPSTPATPAATAAVATLAVAADSSGSDPAVVISGAGDEKWNGRWFPTAKRQNGAPVYTKCWAADKGTGRPLAGEPTVCRFNSDRWVLVVGTTVSYDCDTTSETVPTSGWKAFGFGTRPAPTVTVAATVPDGNISVGTSGTEPVHRAAAAAAASPSANPSANPRVLHARSKLTTRVQLAHRVLRTSADTGATMLTGLHRRAADAFDVEAADVLYFTRNTAAADMTQIVTATTAVAAEDCLTAHLRGRRTTVRVVKDWLNLGLVLADTGAGMVVIKHIEDHCALARLGGVCAGDVLVQADGADLAGKSAAKIAARLKAVAVGAELRIAVISPRPAGSTTTGTSDSLVDTIKPAAPRRAPADSSSGELGICQLIVDELVAGQGAQFTRSVATAGAPDYPDVLAEVGLAAMDLGTVQRKLGAAEYRDAAACVADVELVFANCFAYHPADSAIVAECKRLQRQFTVFSTGAWL